MPSIFDDVDPGAPGSDVAPKAQSIFDAPKPSIFDDPAQPQQEKSATPPVQPQQPLSPEEERVRMLSEPPKVDEKPLKEATKKMGFTEAAQQTYDEGLDKLIPFWGSAHSMADSWKVYSAAMAMRDGKANDDQKRLLDEYASKQAEIAGADKTLGYKVTKLLLNLPAYALEFLLTGGAYAIGAGAVRKVAGEGAKFAARKVALEAAEAAVKKGTQKFIDRTIGEGVGRYAAERVAGAMTQTALGMPLRVADETIRRMTPELGIDPARHGEARAVLLNDGDDLWEALAKAYGSNVVEMLSERMGDLLYPVAALWKGNIGAPLRAALAKRWILGRPGGTWSKFDELLSRAGWHGVVAEMFEERVGDVLQPAVEAMGEGTYAEHFRFPSIHDLAAEAIAFSVPGFVASVYRGSKKKADTMRVEAEKVELSKDVQATLSAYQTPEFQRSQQDLWAAHQGAEGGRLFEGASLVSDIDAEIKDPMRNTTAKVMRAWAAKFGTPVAFVKNFSVSGYRFISDGAVFLDVDKPNTWAWSILGHEFTHRMAKDESFRKTLTDIRALAESSPEVAARLEPVMRDIFETYNPAHRETTGTDLSSEQVWEEYFPRIMETLFSEKGFHERLLAENPGAFEKILTVLREMFEKFAAAIDAISPGTFTRVDLENQWREVGFGRVEKMLTDATKEYLAKANRGEAVNPESKEVAEDNAPAEEPAKSGPGKKSASIPVMITKRMEADLLAKGYAQAQIDAMTPQQANDILQEGEAAKPLVPKGVFDKFATGRSAIEEFRANVAGLRAEAAKKAPAEKPAVAVKEPKAKPVKRLYIAKKDNNVVSLTEEEAQAKGYDVPAEITPMELVRVSLNRKGQWVPQETVKVDVVSNLGTDVYYAHKVESTKGGPQNRLTPYDKKVWLRPTEVPAPVKAHKAGQSVMLVGKKGEKIPVRILGQTDTDWITMGGVDGLDPSVSSWKKWSKAQFPKVENQQPMEFELQFPDSRGINRRRTLTNVGYYARGSEEGWYGTGEDGLEYKMPARRWRLATAPQQKFYTLTDADRVWMRIRGNQIIGSTIAAMRMGTLKKPGLGSGIAVTPEYLEEGRTLAENELARIISDAELTPQYLNPAFAETMQEYIERGAQSGGMNPRVAKLSLWHEEMRNLMQTIPGKDATDEQQRAWSAEKERLDSSKPDPAEIEDFDKEISNESLAARVWADMKMSNRLLESVREGASRRIGAVSMNSKMDSGAEKGDLISDENKIADAPLQVSTRGSARSGYDLNPNMRDVSNRIVASIADGKKPDALSIAASTGVAPEEVEKEVAKVQKSPLTSLQQRIRDELGRGAAKGTPMMSPMLAREHLAMSEQDQEDGTILDGIEITDRQLSEELTIIQRAIDAGEAARPIGEFGRKRMADFNPELYEAIRLDDHLVGSGNVRSNEQINRLVADVLGDFKPDTLDAVYEKMWRSFSRKINSRGNMTLDDVDTKAASIVLRALQFRNRPEDMPKIVRLASIRMRHATQASSQLRQNKFDYSKNEAEAINEILAPFMGEAGSRASAFATVSATAAATGAGLTPTQAQIEAAAISTLLAHFRQKSGRTWEAMTVAEQADVEAKATAALMAIRPYLPTLAPHTNVGTAAAPVWVETPGYRPQFGTYMRALGAYDTSIHGMLLEYWKSAILSGLGTVGLQNPVSNIANGVYEFVVKRPVEALLNAVVPKGLSPGVGSGTGQTFGELLPVWNAMWKAKARAARIFFETWKSEIPYYGVRKEGGWGSVGSVGEVDDKYNNIPGTTGRIIRAPLRFLSATDDFFKHIFIMGQATAVAYREGAKLGHSGARLEAYIDAQLNDRTSTAWTEGVKKGYDLVFQTRLGNVGQGIVGMRQGSFVLQYLFPFITTPINILKQGVRRTPLGTIPLVYRSIAEWHRQKSGLPQQYTREHFIDHFAEQTIAWAAVFMIAGMVGGPDDDDKKPVTVTGGRSTYSKDAGKTQTFERNAGPQPMSIKFGDGPWISYARVEPLATFLAPIVNAIEAMKKAKAGEEWQVAASDAFSRTTDALSDKTFLGSLSDIIAASKNPKEAASFASNFASSWVPAIIRNGLKARRGNEQDMSVKGEPMSPEWFKSLAEKTGGTAIPNDKTPRIDWLGREVKKSGSVSPSTDVLYRAMEFAGVKAKGAKLDDLSRMVTIWNQKNRFDAKENFEYYPSKPNKWITFRGERRFLTDEQYVEYQKLIGHMTENMAKNQRFRYDNPSAIDMIRLQKIREAAVERAGNQMKIKYRW